MDQYWNNVCLLYGENEIQKYLDFNNSMDDNKPLEKYVDKHELLADMITSLLYDALQNHHLPNDPMLDYLEDPVEPWILNLGKYQYLIDLYGCPGCGSEMMKRNELVTEKIREIQDGDLFGLFAVTIMMHLRIIKEDYDEDSPE